MTSHQRKSEIVLLLMECAGDELEETGGTKTWMNMVDRGGLWHINDQTYSIFVFIEEELRRFFTCDPCRQRDGIKDVAMETILQSNDLCFEWGLIAFEVDSDIAMLVLRKTVELYVTVRGFAFAKSCLELYKQAQKKSLQKSRALRSKLCPKQ